MFWDEVGVASDMACERFIKDRRALGIPATAYEEGAFETGFLVGVEWLVQRLRTGSIQLPVLMAETATAALPAAA